MTALGDVGGRRASTSVRSHGLPPLLRSIPVIAALAACADSGTEPPGEPPRAPAAIVVVSGGGQEGMAGSALAEAVVVRVDDAAGSPVAGATVTFSAAAGHGSADPATAATDAAGLASTTWTLGDAAGAQTLTASVAAGVSTDIRAAAGELPATPGIESMAETGGTSTLRSEIRAHLPAAVLSVISGPGLGTSPARTTISSVVVRGDYPLVTLVTMIAPSPDWFVGVSALSLMDDLGQWVDELQVTLYPYDSGTDDGTTYTSVNADSSPKRPIRSLRGMTPFSDAPIGTFTFTRIGG